MKTISYVKYIYRNNKYNIESVDVIAKLRVASVDYDDIVDAIKRKHKDISNVRILSFTR